MGPKRPKRAAAQLASRAWEAVKPPQKSSRGPNESPTSKQEGRRNPSPGHDEAIPSSEQASCRAQEAAAPQWKKWGRRSKATSPTEAGGDSRSPVSESAQPESDITSVGGKRAVVEAIAAASPNGNPAQGPAPDEEAQLVTAPAQQATVAAEPGATPAQQATVTTEPDATPAQQSTMPDATPAWQATMQAQQRRCPPQPTPYPGQRQARQGTSHPACAPEVIDLDSEDEGGAEGACEDVLQVTSGPTPSSVSMPGCAQASKAGSPIPIPNHLRGPASSAPHGISAPTPTANMPLRPSSRSLAQVLVLPRLPAPAPTPTPCLAPAPAPSRSLAPAMTSSPALSSCPALEPGIASAAAPPPLVSVQGVSVQAAGIQEGMGCQEAAGCRAENRRQQGGEAGVMIAEQREPLMQEPGTTTEVQGPGAKGARAEEAGGTQWGGGADAGQLGDGGAEGGGSMAGTLGDTRMEEVRRASGGDDGGLAPAVNESGDDEDPDDGYEPLFVYHAPLLYPEDDDESSPSGHASDSDGSSSDLEDLLEHVEHVFPGYQKKQQLLGKLPAGTKLAKKARPKKPSVAPRSVATRSASCTPQRARARAKGREKDGGGGGGRASPALGAQAAVQDDEVLQAIRRGRAQLKLVRAGIGMTTDAMTRQGEEEALREAREAEAATRAKGASSRDTAGARPGPAEGPESPHDDGDAGGLGYLRLTLRGPGNVKMEVNMKKSDQLRKVFVYFAKKAGGGTTWESFRFQMDGKDLNPESTPEMVDLEDEDLIDVVARNG